MSMSIEDIKKAELEGAAKDIPIFQWKIKVVEMLKTNNRFMTPSDIRIAMNHDKHIYQQLSSLRRRGFIIKKQIGSKKYYGLPEWLGKNG